MIVKRWMLSFFTFFSFCVCWAGCCFFMLCLAHFYFSFPTYSVFFLNQKVPCIRSSSSSFNAYSSNEGQLKRNLRDMNKNPNRRLPFCDPTPYISLVIFTDTREIVLKLFDLSFPKLNGLFEIVDLLFMFPVVCLLGLSGGIVWCISLLRTKMMPSSFWIRYKRSNSLCFQVCEFVLSESA